MHASHTLSDSNRERDLFEDPLPKKKKKVIYFERNLGLRLSSFALAYFVLICNDHSLELLQSTV